MGAILSAYDELIENNLKRIKLLEEKAQQTYEEWFVRMRFPGHESTPIDPATGLPEGWAKCSYFDVLDIMSGGTPKTSVADYWGGEIPFFTPKDAEPSVYIRDTQKSITRQGLEKCNSQLYPKGTVFITARGTVGKVNMASRDMAMNQSCYALRGKENLSSAFVYYSIKTSVDAFWGSRQAACLIQSSLTPLNS